MFLFFVSSKSRSNSKAFLTILKKEYKQFEFNCLLFKSKNFVLPHNTAKAHRLDKIPLNSLKDSTDILASMLYKLN